MGFDVKGKDNKESQSSNFTIKEGKTPKQHKKGLHGFPKFCVIFFSLLIGIPVLLVGVVYACFYDAGHKEVEVIDDYEKSMLFQDILVDSMDHAACEEHVVSLDLKEIQLNSLLNALLKNNESLSKFIPNLYIDTNTNTFSIVLEANAFNLFKTRLFIDANYQLEDENGCKTLVFDIANMKLGRISGMQKLVDPIIGLIGLPDLSKMFKDMGLSINVDLSHLKITYKVSDFCTDIENIMTQQGVQVEGFLQLVLEILKDDVFEDVRIINGPQKGSLLSFAMDLDSVQTTAITHGATGYSIPKGQVFNELSYTVNAIVGMMNKGILDKDHQTNEEIQLISKYIMGGDYLVSPNDNEILRLTGLGAFDGVSIKQVNYEQNEDEKIENIIKNKISTAISTLPATAEITIADINKSFEKNPLSAPIVPFIRNKGSEELKDYKMNYVNTDRLSVLVNNNNLFVTMNMNVNGYDTNLTFKCPNQETSEFGKMKFKIDELYYGDCKVSDTIKNAYKNTIQQAFNNPVIKAEGDYFIIDISSVLSDLHITSSDCNVSFTCNSYLDNTNPGGLSLTITPKS